LARLDKRGQQAWKDIGNATEWIDQIRGGEH
jgi:hypothetical protein